MRGEQLLRLQLAVGAPGSSPRARGTARGKHTRLRQPGIIPACAGNRCRFPRPPQWLRDHPRVRGEQMSVSSTASMASGSSPRARGTVEAVQASNDSKGIIPACAGNRGLIASGRIAGRDHPRVRGEQTTKSMSARDVTGSSPRARGTGSQSASSSRLTGIIPARAGNSTRPAWMIGRSGIIPACAGNRTVAFSPP